MREVVPGLSCVNLVLFLDQSRGEFNVILGLPSHLGLATAVFGEGGPLIR